MVKKKSYKTSLKKSKLSKTHHHLVAAFLVVFIVVIAILVYPKFDPFFEDDIDDSFEGEIDVDTSSFAQDLVNEVESSEGEVTVDENINLVGQGFRMPSARDARRAAQRAANEASRTAQAAAREAQGTAEDVVEVAQDVDACDLVRIKTPIRVKENLNARHNILFIGDIDSGYNKGSLLKSDVRKLIDYNDNSNYDGLFSVEPFKSNRDKFNIYAARASIGTNLIGNNNAAAKAVSIGLANCAAKRVKNNFGDRVEKVDYVIALSRKGFRSLCIAETPCVVSVGRSISKRDASVVSHEFAHGMAGIADEYVDTNAVETLGDLKSVSRQIFGRSIRNTNDLFDTIGIIAPPNCVSSASQAQDLWGNYAQGCAFSPNLYRPNILTKMGTHRSSTFGEINEQRIQDVIDGRTNIVERGGLVDRFHEYK
jgi:hypothetical protein